MGREPAIRSTASVGEALLSGAETMVVVLPTFWSMLQLGTWWDPPVDAIVFAVMLGIALPRALRAVDRSELPAVLGLFAASSGAAVGCGMLLAPDTRRRVWGCAAFSAGVALLVWQRRFSPSLRRPGVIASTPFIAVLAAPRSIDPTWTLLGWMLLAAGAAMTWALTVRTLSGLTEPPSRPEPPRRRRGGPQASTRMAVQLGCATAASFAAAQLMDPDHLVWPVLTVLIVHSANQGRGDVLWKGAQRIIGALAGTAIATVLSTWSSTGEASTLVALFAILAVAAAARPCGYAFWAAGITAALTFLYGYFGESASEMLGHRLLGVLVGGAIGMASAWFILPVRTVDVARLRTGALLALCRDALSAAGRGEPVAAFEQPLAAADERLRRLSGTMRAAGLLGSGTARELRSVMADAHALASRLLGLSATDRPVGHEELGLLARWLAAAHEALTSSGGRSGPRRGTPAAPDGPGALSRRRRR